MNTAFQIITANYQENVKWLKEVCTFLPVGHPKREKLTNEVNKIRQEMEKLKTK